MGLGVLEDKVLSHVPGTDRLDDADSSSLGSHPDVKRSKDGVILVPQPSDDPMDPLNWPLWRRDMITLILCLAAVFCATLTPLMAANSLTFFFWFPGVTITEVAMLTGWHMLGCGLGGYCFVASAQIWGKRHLYLLGMLIIVVCSVWAGFSGHNYKSLVAARFFQGVGLAPFEALLNASVGELYFVHESGLRMALSNMSLFGASFLTPVIVGQLTASIGWPWTFWIVAICVGATFPAVYVFCPETTFVRDSQQALERNASSDSNLLPDSKVSTSAEKFESPTSYSTDVGNLEYSGLEHTMPQPAVVSRQSMRLFTGRKTNESFLKIFIRPLPLYLHPHILWACIVQGSIVGWTTLLGVMLAVLMVDLGFNEVQTGNMYTGAIVGALLGFVGCSLIGDIVPRWMTRLNKGVYEPEFRLVLIIPLLVFAAGGLYGFGIVASDPSYGYLLPDVFFGCLCGGLVFGTVAPALYIVDAHRDLSVEAFTCMLLFKNTICWALCYNGYQWVNAIGPKKLFSIIASVEVGICLLTIPLYIFGKKSRSFFYRHDYLKMIGLK